MSSEPRTRASKTSMIFTALLTKEWRGAKELLHFRAKRRRRLSTGLKLSLSRRKLKGRACSRRILWRLPPFLIIEQARLAFLDAETALVIPFEVHSPDGYRHTLPISCPDWSVAATEARLTSRGSESINGLWKLSPKFAFPTAYGFSCGKFTIPWTASG